MKPLMNTLLAERIPVLNDHLLEQSERRLGLAERVAMRMGLWMLLWSIRYERNERHHDERLANQEHLDRESREQHYVSLLGLNRPY